MLRPRMHMKFRLFDVHELSLIGGEKSDEDRKHLRNPKANVGDVYQVFTT